MCYLAFFFFFWHLGVFGKKCLRQSFMTEVWLSHLWIRRVQHRGPSWWSLQRPLVLKWWSLSALSSNLGKCWREPSWLACGQPKESYSCQSLRCTGWDVGRRGILQRRGLLLVWRKELDKQRRANRMWSPFPKMTLLVMTSDLYARGSELI